MKNISLEIQIAIVPYDKTLIGFDYNSGMADFKGKQVLFHQFGIGIGIIVLYFTVYRKGD